MNPLRNAATALSPAAPVRPKRLGVAVASSVAATIAAVPTATAALELLRCGVILIDAQCRVCFANREARAICGQADGISLRAFELIGTTLPGAARLNDALRRAIEIHESTSLRLARPSGRRSLALLVAPLATQAGVRAAAVWLTDPERFDLPSRERLMSLYRLTLAEAGITRLLLAGSNLAEAARQLGITVQTARAHLRGVLGKTATHRQSELIRLLMHELSAAPAL